MMRRVVGLVLFVSVAGLWFSLGGAMLAAVGQESGAVGGASTPTASTVPVVSGGLPITGSPSLGLALIGLAAMAWGLAWSIGSLRQS